MKKKFVSIMILVLLNTGFLFALEKLTYFGIEGALYIDDNKGFNISNGFAPISYTPVLSENYSFSSPDGKDLGRDLGSGWGAFKSQFYVTQEIKVPFLQGANALISDNNILYSLKGTFSPISINAIISATLTPIAFLNFQVGSSIGTGWNIPGFSNGLGMNIDGTGIPAPDSLAGIVFKPWLSATFQFDMGAVIPGEWTHVLLSTTARFEYKYYSAAKTGQPWQYQADEGENFNGLSYLGTYILAYRLPFKVDTAGILVETEQMLGNNKILSPMSSYGWGSDFIKITFGPLINIQLTTDSSIIILMQFSAEKSYTKATVFNNYFITRKYEETYIDFHRIAFSYTKKIK